jgi:cytochrome c peroxidase
LLEKNSGNNFFSTHAKRMKTVLALICLAIITPACHLPTPSELAPQNVELIAKGKEIFFNEKFNGNGRTCGTCHREENNFTIDPAFIATLPDDDPLFVAEFNPDLKDHFENPRLLRTLGLVLMNPDTFDDLAHNFVLRGVPHTLGLRFSVNSDLGPRTGWSGDGAPGDASLRAFAAGAVIQHFTKTLNRIPDIDFRLPTEAELDALAAFQLSLGRQAALTFPLPLKGKVAARGQKIFNDATQGKCFICHFNGGATGDPRIFGPHAGNLNFNTGVEDFSNQPQDLTGELVPPDDGFGTPGSGSFNTPSLIEAADTGPFFHNNLVKTIEDAVGFYSSDAFNISLAGQLIKEETGSGINLNGTQVLEVAAFLRVVNALENIRQSIDILDKFALKNFRTVKDGNELLRRALAETRDSAMVLKGGDLHPEAVGFLQKAKKLTEKARHGIFFKGYYARVAIEMQEQARNELVVNLEP